jgi:hypothetical protein
MNDRQSRYRTVPPVTAPDPQGRRLPAGGLRALPDVAGTVRHRVSAGDRLDQLAQTYYGRPEQWWHICDANPEVLSPLELVGAEPVTTTDFPVVVNAELPPWAELVRQLMACIGVEGVSVLEPPLSRGPCVVQVRHNRVTAPARLISDRLAQAPFGLAGPPVEHGRIGEPVTIPAPATG